MKTIQLSSQLILRFITQCTSPPWYFQALPFISHSPINSVPVNPRPTFVDDKKAGCWKIKMEVSMRIEPVTTGEMSTQIPVSDCNF